MSAGSLYRWSRAVDAKDASSPPAEEDELRLLEAVMEPVAATAPEVWSLELTGPRGTLRVRGPMMEFALLVVLGAVLEGRGR